MIWTRIFFAFLLTLLPVAGQPFGASALVRNADGANERLAAVAKFDNCTGFVIRPSANTPDTAPAYLLTAGHCLDQSVTAVVRDRALTNRFATFRFFIDTPSRQQPVRATHATYSTMKGTDLAIVRLETTLAGLGAQGIRPLTLARATPTAGEPVFWAGVPFDGIVPRAEQFLRTSDCTLGPAAELVEWRWHWYSMLRNDCSDIRGGASGSPLFSKTTGDVIGVITTTNAGAAFTGGDFRCYLAQPCEVTRGGFTYRPDTGYAAPVAGLASCFDANGEFAIGEGCPLDDGRQLNVSNAATAVQPGANWNANVTGTAWPMFRYKIVPEGDGDCRDSSAYSAPVAVDQGFRITDAVGSRIGRQYLCVVGTTGAVSQNPLHATLIHLRVDNTPPTTRLFYTIREDFVIQPIFVLPELGRYRYKTVAANEAGCADMTGYREYLRVPIRVPAGSAERFCLIGYDEAENASPVTDLPLVGTNIFAGGVVNAASGGAVAPGAIVGIYGTNLPAAGVSLIDGAGMVHVPEILYQSPLQMNARIPANAVPGAATLRVAGARMAVTIAELAPGLFNAYELEGDRVLWLAGTGFARTVVAEARVSGVRLDATVVQDGGLDWVRVEFPRDFRLRGRVPVQVRAGFELTNTIWIDLVTASPSASGLP